jgi:hypothetical protein
MTEAGRNNAKPDYLSLRATYFINTFEGHYGGTAQLNMVTELPIKFFYLSRYFIP